MNAAGKDSGNKPNTSQPSRKEQRDHTSNHKVEPPKKRPGQS
ncbi:hypothetical protein CDPAHKCJ_01673 [Cobetia sp. MB87]|nr:hypothetical protein [Cobetia sp. MB87]